MYKHKILILGGSTEGFLLAQKINSHYGGAVETITSFAGITQKRRAVIGRSRVGGFGGVAGLANYLKSENISYVIDATHPFAARIKKNLDEAAQQVQGVKWVHVLRPQWQAQEGDQWLLAGDMEQAAHCLNGFAKNSTVFLAVGRKELSAFSGCASIDFIARVIDPPQEQGLPPKISFIVERGPFDLQAERALFDAHDIAAVVCKNSGGDAASAKLQVARELGIPVVMVRRPEPPEGESVATVEEAIGWLDANFRF